jgi:hypothetical protein
MAWGAINELTTLTGYHQLIRRSSHPQLQAMLRPIIRDERRHFAFYRAEAKARLTDNPKAGRVVRWALRRFWTPVGAGVKSDEEVDALGLYLFADAPEGRGPPTRSTPPSPPRPGSRPDAARRRARPRGGAHPPQAGLGRRSTDAGAGPVARRDRGVGRPRRAGLVRA